MTTALPIPGALERADVTPSTAWAVELGRAQRGDAWTNPTDHRLRIPAGDDPAGRVVRAHELMHAKTSPALAPYIAAAASPEYPAAVIAAVDEIRVNFLAGLMGHDLDQLCDGSERVGGSRIGNTREAWQAAVEFAAATWTTGRMGGKAHREFMTGLKTANPTWAKLLGQMTPALKSAARELGSFSWTWGDTTPATINTDEHGALVLPSGYLRVLAIFGPVVMRWWQYDASGMDDDTTPGDIRTNHLGKSAAGSRRGPSGSWAALVVGPTDLAVTGPTFGRAKAKRPSVTGRSVRYPSRLMTDPQRRIMAGPSRRSGGVLVVDLSGSMDVDPDDLDRLMAAAGGLTILGYSHRPGDTTGAPNAWVLARNGRRVASTRGLSNVGNGVDGPALAWAAKVRGSGPFVWLCDGQTTDSNDHPYGDDEAARFVRRHRVHMVRDVDGAVRALTTGEAAKVRCVDGRVGRAWRGEARY